MDLRADGVIREQQLKHAGTPGIAGVAAHSAARAATGGAALTNQALGQHAQQRGTEQERLHAKLLQRHKVHHQPLMAVNL